MGIDAFDTPPALAAALVRFARPTAPSVVADFSVGTGELLLAAEALWPEAEYVATDIDEVRARHLRGERPGWVVRQLDFTSPEVPEVLDQWVSGVDLVLLNPPFSCRGGRRHEVETPEGQVPCSLAMAFVLLAVPFLSKGGEMLAILPRGCVDSDKDAPARGYLSRTAGFQVLQEHGRGTFTDCTPSTVIVRIGGTPASPPVERSSEVPASLDVIGKRPLRIYRGRLPCHAASTVGTYLGSNSFRYIHTTDLVEGEVSLGTRRVSVGGTDENRLTVRGPAVLVPRVGRPYVEKVALHVTSERIVLSDCVVALLCESAKEARILYSALRKEWSLFERVYGGTCAKYTTLRKIRTALQELGYSSEIVRKGESPRTQPVVDVRELQFIGTD